MNPINPSVAQTSLTFPVSATSLSTPESIGQDATDLNASDFNAANIASGDDRSFYEKLIDRIENAYYIGVMRVESQRTDRVTLADYFTVTSLHSIKGTLEESRLEAGSAMGYTPLEIGQTYLLLIAKFEAVYQDNPSYVLSGEIFPVQDGKILAAYIDRTTDAEGLFKTVDDFISFASQYTDLSKNGIVHSMYYSKTDNFEEAVLNSRSIVRVKITEAGASDLENRYFFYCDILEVLKGKPYQTVKVCFLKTQKIEVGQEYVLLLDMEDDDIPETGAVKAPQAIVTSKTQSVIPVSDTEKVEAVRAFLTPQTSGE